MNRILVIRGGAIGDFILTLPAIRALRVAFPAAHFEILGYKHVAAMAEGRMYANAVRSIEYAALARFFARAADLDPVLREWFGTFDLILSYLYDPDDLFEQNLHRSGAKKVLRGPFRIDPNTGLHASVQLAAPLRELGIEPVDPIARLFPSDEDRRFASEFLALIKGPILAIHPGSGSESKNWPIENWIELGNVLLGERDRHSLVVVGGEADEERVRALEAAWSRRNALFARNLPLPRLAAVIERAGVFVGHDSGISHLAAATGARCVLLFGPTDPKIWAPQGDHVQIILGDRQRMEDIDVKTVIAASAWRDDLRVVPD